MACVLFYGLILSFVCIGEKLLLFYYFNIQELCSTFYLKKHCFDLLIRKVRQKYFNECPALNSEINGKPTIGVSTGTAG